MQLRRFGQTGLEVSVFSLGTMRYLASQEGAIATIQQAIEQGINHLETAQGYGNSEEYLSAALRRGVCRPRSELIITTKIPPTADANSMAASIDRSLQRLGLDSIDCLAVHGINTSEHLQLVERPDGCMAAVRQAIAAGKVRHVGFSTHAPLEIILKAIATDQFEFVNLHYYFFNQRNAAAVELAHQKNMGVFIISPADKGGMLYTPPDTLRQLCKPDSPLHLTYRFLLSDPRVTTLSVGPANPRELEEPLAIAHQTEPLTSEEKRLLENLLQHQQTVLATDQCSQCFKCLPCPETINIPEVLRLRNLAIAYDMTDFGKYRYGMFENAGHWFPGRRGDRCTNCGDCLPRCPEQLDIPRLLRDTHERLGGKARRRLWE